MFKWAWFIKVHFLVDFDFIINYFVQRSSKKMVLLHSLCIMTNHRRNFLINGTTLGTVIRVDSQLIISSFKHKIIEAHHEKTFFTSWGTGYNMFF